MKSDELIGPYKQTLMERIRFRVALLLNKSDRFCWTELVTWALGWPDSSINNAFTGEDCKHEAQTHSQGTCYCGKFKRNG